MFGVTGDLARKKLIPAVYDLANRGLLPPGFVLLGFARRDWGDGDFEEVAREAARKGARTEFREETWRRLADAIRFIPGSFDDDAAFDQLAAALTELDATHGTQGNAAFYLSIPPSAFPTVLSQMRRTGMADNDQSGGWRRVVVEKPFGEDLASAKELNHLVDSVFTAQDVFRIDHYLGKETVQNLLALRFANELFEPIWNRQHIDSVQITMAEDVGIGGRAAFYEQTGAARDVLQNHLLQLLALTAMEEPASFDAESLRTEKRKVLSAVLPPSDLARYAVRGQYDQGWLAGERVQGLPRRGGRRRARAAPRRTPPCAWRSRAAAGRACPSTCAPASGCPRRVTEIAVLFRKAPVLPFAQTDTEELGSNQLVVRVQPDEGMTLRFGSKVPGTQMEVRDVAMDFLYGEAFTESSPEAYERLLLDVLLGDASLFPRNEEVEQSWRVIDPIEQHWREQEEQGGGPELYRAGEWGPQGADEMLAHDGRAWRRP